MPIKFEISNPFIKCKIFFIIVFVSYHETIFLQYKVGESIKTIEICSQLWTFLTHLQIILAKFYKLLPKLKVIWNNLKT